MSVKTSDFFLCDFTRATTPATHSGIFFPPFPHTLSFAILYTSTSIMCFKTIPVVSRPRSNITRRRQRNPANLRPISTSSTTPLSFSMALWNCQSAVNKADFIPAFSLQSTLSILGLTETWIRPEDSATPAALSNNFSFSHTPRQVGRGGGTGLLISNNWKYSTHSPLCNYNSFESHAITVMAPIKLQIVVIYRPPGQILAPFLEELDGLLSSFMEDGTPLLVFGDFNIHLEKPYATDFHSLTNRHISITRSTMLQICVISSEHLILSYVPLHHLPPLLSQLMSLQLFLQTKLKQSAVSFHLHSHRTPNQLDPLLKLPSSPSVPSLRRKYPNFSSPAILQRPLDPIPSHLLQAISPALLPALTHIINTSLLTGIFPTAFKQARVTPLLKKPTLNTSLLENYRPISLLPFIAKTLERVVFNQVSLFLS